jgi:head-tail adaptor
MRGGTLRTWLKLQPPDVVSSPDGSEVITWPTDVMAWGAVTPMTGREYLASNVVSDAVDTKIIVRNNFAQQPDARWRVVDPTSGRIYNVLSALYEQDNSNVTLLCRTVTGAGDGR